jgi:hypothetical protein
MHVNVFNRRLPLGGGIEESLIEKRACEILRRSACTHVVYWSDEEMVS